MNLRVAILFQVLIERSLSEETIAFTRSSTTSSTSSLLCTSTTDWTDEERLDAQARIINFLLGEARVDHINDSIDRKRCLSDVSCYNNLATNLTLAISCRCIIENAVLLLWWQGTIERYNLNRAGDFLT